VNTILLIDQDTNILEMLQTSLARAGYTVRIAVDGNAGLRLAHTEKPDLIVLDMLLPGLSGVELCQELQKDKATKDIPVFLISALTVPPANTPWRPAPDAEIHILRYRAYLPKPLNLKQFLQKVESIIHPHAKFQQATGQVVLLISADNARQENIRHVLTAHDFNVRAYDRIIKPLEAFRAAPPAAWIIDQPLLTADVWQALEQVKKRNPALGLIVLQDEQSLALPPAHLEQIDALIPPQVQPWQLAARVKQALEYQNIKERVGILSRQLLELNDEVVGTKNTLLAQNRELDFMNRRLRKLSELKELLTGMLVHDLKAPLTAMMGAMQFLTMDPDNTITEGSRKILSGGLAAGKQMQRLTETLLDEQKLENNQLVFDIEPTNFEEVLGTSIEMMSPLFNMYKVTLNTQIPPDLPLLQADPMILQRIIENLLDNAVKYSPANEAISVQITPKGNIVEICIADRGEGIPPEQRDSVFDRFTQLEAPKAERIRGGVGLGLTFCKLAVETMGGEIWVGSLNNVGAAFFFTLPILKNENNNFKS
jgi:signal transduction histidine kinase